MDTCKQTVTPIRGGAKIAPCLLATCIVAGCVANPEKDGAGGNTGGGYVSIAGLTLGGAAKDVDLGSGYIGQLSSNEKDLRERAGRFDRTVWQGMLAGGVAGALVGIATGRPGDQVAGMTIAGAGIGALAGAYLANKQKSFARAEDQLDAMINDVRRSNDDSRRLIASLTHVIAEDRRRLQTLTARVEMGQARQIELDQQLERMRANRSVVEKAQVGAREQLAVLARAKSDFEGQNADIGTAPLERELATFRSNLDDLDAIVTTLSQG